MQYQLNFKVAGVEIPSFLDIRDDYNVILIEYLNATIDVSEMTQPNVTMTKMVVK